MLNVVELITMIGHVPLAPVLPPTLAIVTTSPVVSVDVDATVMTVGLAFVAPVTPPVTAVVPLMLPAVAVVALMARHVPPAAVMSPHASTSGPYPSVLVSVLFERVGTTWLTVPLVQHPMTH
jgi:hypothetical protein